MQRSLLNLEFSVARDQQLKLACSSGSWVSLNTFVAKNVQMIRRNDRHLVLAEVVAYPSIK